MTRAGWASLPFFSLHLFFPYFNLDIFFVTPSFPSLILLCFNLFVHSPPPSDTTIVNRRPNPMLPLPFSCFRQHVPEGLTLTDWEHEQFSKSAPKSSFPTSSFPTGLSVNVPGGAASEGTAGGENAGMYVDIYIYIYIYRYIHTYTYVYIDTHGK